jgi:hypothetical protein
MVSKILYMRVTSLTNIELWMNDYYVIYHKTHVSYASDRIVNFNIMS